MMGAVRSPAVVALVVLVLVLPACGSREDATSGGLEFIDATMASVFPETTYVVESQSVICEWSGGEYRVGLQATFDLPADLDNPSSAVAEYWITRDDTDNVEFTDSRWARGNAHDALVTFGAHNDGVGYISLQGGPCRDGAVKATSIVVTPGE